MIKKEIRDFIQEQLDSIGHDVGSAMENLVAKNIEAMENFSKSVRILSDRLTEVEARLKKLEQGSNYYH